jgi:hypothetical protein
MAHEAEQRAEQEAIRRADEKLDKLFESPYLIRSPEVPADLSDIGNGHEKVIKDSIDRLINELPAIPRDDAEDPFETPLLDA